MRIQRLMVWLLACLVVGCANFPPSHPKAIKVKHKDKYTREQREQILATLMDVTWPLKPPFEPEPFRLLDEIVKEKPRNH